MTDQINDKLTSEQLIERFASLNNISKEEAEQLVGAESEEEILKKIEEYTLQRINQNMPQLNRAQRRALAKSNKGKKKKSNPVVAVSETAKKINYIDLIQRLRDLNEKRENEEYEDVNENN